MHNSFFLFLLVLLFSCSRQNIKIEKYIANNNIKYWYRYHNDTLKSYAMGYAFNVDGTYIKYCNPEYNFKIRAICNNQNTIKPIWKVIDDTTIMIGEGVLYRIVAINQDSMVLRNLKFRDDPFFKLHRDNDQTTKPKAIIYWDTLSPISM